MQPYSPYDEGLRGLTRAELQTLWRNLQANMPASAPLYKATQNLIRQRESRYARNLAQKGNPVR